MADFTSSKAATSPMDPLKRVNYTFGLVLGPDEFIQEQTYFLEKDRLHNRALHGYGTVSGLKVQRGTGADLNLEIQVTAGLALSPGGHEICVPRLMCARVNEWLTRHRAELEAIFGSAPAQPLSLAVVLCYRECETDTIPVPGELCRPQSEAMSASRIRDAFEIRLCLNERNPADGPTSPPASPPASPPSSPPSGSPGALCRYRPAQREEEAVRALGQLLDSILIADSGTSFATEDDVLAAVRAIVQGFAPTSPPSSPPPSPPSGVLTLRTSEACDILRAALRVWVTEVRPYVLGQCICGAAGEQCVLLAEVTVPVSNWLVSGEISIDERNRPYLVSTRVLQEWLTCAPGAAAAPSSPPASPPASPPSSPPGSPPSSLAGGDLTGNYPDPTIAFFQGRRLAVLPNDPIDADALAWSTQRSQWEPRHFVQAPAATARVPVSIVAAGRFNVNPETGEAVRVGPVYGRLEAVIPVTCPPAGFGFFLLRWADYRNPDRQGARHNYIVKALCFGDGRGQTTAMEAMRFDDQGLFVRAGMDGAPPRGFMVEVTEIGVTG